MDAIIEKISRATTQVTGDWTTGGVLLILSDRSFK